MHAYCFIGQIKQGILNLETVASNMVDQTKNSPITQEITKPECIQRDSNIYKQYLGRSTTQTDGIYETSHEQTKRCPTNQTNRL